MWWAVATCQAFVHNMFIGDISDSHYFLCICRYALPCQAYVHMGWLRLVRSLKLYVFSAKELYKRDNILQKRPAILRSLLIVSTSYYASVFQAVIACQAYTHNIFIGELYLVCTYTPPSPTRRYLQMDTICL